MARLLVLDDDSLTLDTWSWVLRDAGHDVETAASGRLGLEAVRTGNYELVLADLFLGDMTAIELLDQMNAAGIVVPVIVTTGFGTIETAVAAMRRGAVNYVTKPLIGDDLIRQVDLGLAWRTVPAATPGASHPHAAARWAQAVVGLLRAREDVRTLGQWGRSVGLAASTLRTVCQMAGLPPKRSLTLARVLRAVYQSRQTVWRPAHRLDVSDPRTLRRMLADAGLLTATDSVTVNDLLVRQSLIADIEAMAALRRALLDTDPSLVVD